MINEEQLIFDFCNWLTEQGCLYETIYYGTDNDIEKMIDNYLMIKKSNDKIISFKKKKGKISSNSSIR